MVLIMTRKPEWLLMYQDLVNLHYDGGLEFDHQHRFPHVRKVAGDTDMTQHIEWCLENLDMDTWTWGWEMAQDLFDQGWHVFTFSKERDSVLFAMTWQ